MNHGPNYIKAAAHLEMSIHVDPDNQWVLLAEGTLAAEEAEAVGVKRVPRVANAWREHFDRMPPLALRSHAAVGGGDAGR